MSILARILRGIPPVLVLLLSATGSAQEGTLPAMQSARPAPRPRQPDAGESQVQMARDAYAPRPIPTAVTTFPSGSPVEDSAEQDYTLDSVQCHDDCHHHRGVIGRIKGWWHHRRNWRACTDCDRCTDCEAHSQVPDQLPLGYFLNEHLSTQISNGEAARMVLYRYDFIDGTERLKPRGKRRLAEIAKALPRNFHPVIIQQTEVRPSGNAKADEQLQMAAEELDRKRKQTVVAALREMTTLPVPEQRVRIGLPPSPGLRADEEQAKTVYERLLVPEGSVGAGAAGAPAAGSVGMP